MESKPEKQDGIWEGDGPQASPSPTVTCQHASNPAQCDFPLCQCSGLQAASTAAIQQWPAELKGAPDKAAIVTNADLRDLSAAGERMGRAIDETIIAQAHKAIVPGVDLGTAHGTFVAAYTGAAIQAAATLKEPGEAPKRKPKRDRAAYMRTYRSQQRAARTQ